MKKDYWIKKMKEDYWMKSKKDYIIFTKIIITRK